MKCILCNKEHGSRQEAIAAHKDGDNAGSDAFQHAAVLGGRLYRRLGRDGSFNGQLKLHNQFLNYLMAAFGQDPQAAIPAAIPASDKVGEGNPDFWTSENRKRFLA